MDKITKMGFFVIKTNDCYELPVTSCEKLRTDPLQ